MLLINRGYLPGYTMSELLVLNSEGIIFNCFTLERPWLSNKTDISCIPPGDYEANKYVSKKHGACISIPNVEERTNILIHVGNWLHQTKGCLLIGAKIQHSDKGIMITSSKLTLEKLLKHLPNKFRVRIR